MIKAVLFDMGSTLLEFENHPWDELIYQGIDAVYDALFVRGAVLPERHAFCHALRETYRTTWQQAEQSLEEMDIRGLLDEATRGLGLSLSEADLGHLVRAHYMPVSTQVTIYTDTRETLACVRERGLKIGLISNTIWPAQLHKEDLQRFGIMHFFDHLLFSTDVGVRKPHPQIFWTALAALQVTPGEALFVGDRFPEDVAGSKRVGMFSVWKERADRERDPQVVPDAQILHLRELLPLLDGLLKGNGA